MDIQITIDRAELERFASLGKGLANAVRKAGGDALRKMRTTSTQTIRFRKRMKLKAINDALVLTFPKTKELDAMLWRMDVKGDRLKIADYASRPRQTLRGVTVGINAGKRVLIPHAFIATMRSGHKGVWLRVNPTTKRGGPDHTYALPIRELYTTRVADLFSDAGMIPAVVAQTLRAFDQTFGRVLPLELAR